MYLHLLFPATNVKMQFGVYQKQILVKKNKLINKPHTQNKLAIVYGEH